MPKYKFTKMPTMFSSSRVSHQRLGAIAAARTFPTTWRYVFSGLMLEEPAKEDQVPGYWFKLCGDLGWLRKIQPGVLKTRLPVV